MQVQGKHAGTYKIIELNSLSCAGNAPVRRDGNDKSPMFISSHVCYCLDAFTNLTSSIKKEKAFASPGHMWMK